MENIFFQTSLIAAFAAGIIALFAPCCITFLLPAYLGSVFKEKEKVILMTLVFGAGIFVTLMPAVLGVALISRALFRYHDFVYILGGLIMILVALSTFLGIKMPMPNLPATKGGRTDILSIFTMGIFSGITSACCAPVLIGIMTLTFLSPNFFGALLIGGVYVLGMVIPLLLISLFLSNKVSKLAVLRKSLFSFTLLGGYFSVTFSNFIASLIFLVTGILSLVLTVNGKLSSQEMNGFTKMLKDTITYVNNLVSPNASLNLILLLGLIFFIYWVAKKV